MIQKLLIKDSVVPHRCLLWDGSGEVKLGPSLKIHRSVSQDETVRQLNKSVLTQFMQLNSLSESALLIERASAIWVNFERKG